MKGGFFTIEVGTPAPDFSLPDADGKETSLSQFRGKTVVLYFYSKDNTAGCNVEAQEFAAINKDAAKLGAVIIGVSRDTAATHKKFAEKYQLPFVLLSDEERAVGNLYGVVKMKNMYGKKVLGVERSTFVISPAGVVTHIFRKVKPQGHAKEVLSSLMPPKKTAKANHK